jgi:hypothetical protein
MIDQEREAQMQEPTMKRDRVVYMAPNALIGRSALVFHRGPLVEEPGYGLLSRCCRYGLGEADWIAIGLDIALRCGGRPCGDRSLQTRRWASAQIAGAPL